jgi:tetratricopeptide (TPR) repeat protein
MELARQGKLEEGVAQIENLLQFHPRLVDAHVGLISLYTQLGQFAKGEEHYLAAKRLDPNHPGSFFNQGVLLARQGSFARAEREFRRVLEINPAYPKAHTHLASVLEAQNRWSEASAVFGQALENDPEDLQAHFGLGRVFVKQENYREGLPHLAKAAETDDEDSKPAYLYALGAAWARGGDVKKGIDYLRQAREKAMARGQAELVESIGQDLRALEAAGSSP